jgi:hypothetical protein
MNILVQEESVVSYVDANWHIYADNVGKCRQMLFTFVHFVC